jgi:hypothetical protein
VNRESVGVRAIHRNKLKPALHEPRYHLDIARKPVKSRDYKHCPGDATKAQRLGKLRPAILPPAHDLGKLGDNKAGIGADVILDRRSLGFDAETEPPLLYR